MNANQEIAIQKAISQLLLRNSKDIARFVSTVDELERRYGDEVYPNLLYTTATLEYQKRSAKKRCKEVFRYWEGLSASAGREIDFRVALLDYFIDINRRIKNPKIVELTIFQKTQQESYVDGLTQLYNYRYFSKALEHETARAKRYGSPLTLLILDADDFKHYNDTNGHLTGNKALHKLAHIIRKSVRNVDIVARYGGEEFVLLLPETDKGGGLVIAERIRQKVAASRFVNGKDQPLGRVSVSGGVASLHVDAQTSCELVKKADRALYRAKASGKDQIALFVEERRSAARADIELAGVLEHDANEEVPVEIGNISENGLLFFYGEEMSLGASVALRLNLPGRKRAVPCRAKVRRVEELAEAGRYQIGVSFTQLKPAHKGAIKRLIRSVT